MSETPVDVTEYKIPRGTLPKICLPGMSNNCFVYSMCLHSRRKSIKSLFSSWASQLAHRNIDRMKLEIAMGEIQGKKQQQKDFATQ